MTDEAFSARFRDGRGHPLFDPSGLWGVELRYVLCDLIAGAAGATCTVGELVEAVESNPLLDWTETAIATGDGAAAPSHDGNGAAEAPPEADWGPSDGEPWYERIGPSDHDDGTLAEITDEWRVSTARVFRLIHYNSN